MSYLYETPWWLPTGLALMGIILFWTGNNRGEKPLMRGGLAALAAGILLGAVSYVLESDREQIISRTHQLVASVARHDWQAMRGLLHPQVAVIVLKGPEQVVETTRRAAERSGLESVRIAGMNTTGAESAFTVTMQVGATTRMGFGISNWQLQWEKTEQGWLLLEADPLDGPGASAAMLQDYVTRRLR